METRKGLYYRESVVYKGNRGKTYPRSGKRDTFLAKTNWFPQIYDQFPRVYDEFLPVYNRFFRTTISLSLEMNWFLLQTDALFTFSNPFLRIANYSSIIVNPLLPLTNWEYLTEKWKSIGANRKSMETKRYFPNINPLRVEVDRFPPKTDRFFRKTKPEPDGYRPQPKPSDYNLVLTF
ncbi:hypothetical protein [Parapedobacter tibetensis]|uniref:hypothetical protein n=1 Tax=Parapedobacter tibetensis TaxID=2972951 RepID=UPI00214D8742|nr:hypothetical protein [Parapedobacter tibetensis]